MDESDEKVYEVEKKQGKARPTINFPPPFPQRLHKKEESDKLSKFMTNLSNLSINIPLFEVIQEILGYTKLMKKLMSKNKLVVGDTTEVILGCSAIMDAKVPEKKDEPRVFTILFTIGTHVFAKAHCNLGASINLIPFVIYKTIGFDTFTLTSMRLLIADWSIKRLVGRLFDVLMKVEKFIFSIDFVVLDCKMDKECPIILGRPFLDTRRAIVDLELREMKF
ncbi:uncharacterized protein LOC124898539 [Capsicum annuum]|uniref:uncharacterized protein LOC124898539 n=1 Tax=Capsicum annuum TaxID=4072 RepID=UPI001FB18477|nr:uncharacterized protein LOC124898539 [Capsicum annuum]